MPESGRLTDAAKYLQQLWLLLTNTDWTALRYVSVRMICGSKENAAGACSDCIRATDQCGTTWHNSTWDIREFAVE